MANVIDLNSLGTEYHISDAEGTISKVIRIFMLDDILSAGVGQFSYNKHDFNSYLKDSIDSFTGFDPCSITNILWYSSFDNEVYISEILEYAIINDYDKVIIEYLEDID